MVSLALVKDEFEFVQWFFFHLANCWAHGKFTFSAYHLLHNFQWESIHSTGFCCVCMRVKSSLFFHMSWASEVMNTCFHTLICQTFHSKNFSDYLSIVRFMLVQCVFRRVGVWKLMFRHNFDQNLTIHIQSIIVLPTVESLTFFGTPMIDTWEFKRQKDVFALKSNSCTLQEQFHNKQCEKMGQNLTWMLLFRNYQSISNGKCTYFSFFLFSSLKLFNSL